MGAESKCTLTFGKTRADGKALLETDALIFRGGDVRLSVPYKQMSSVEAKNGGVRLSTRLSGEADIIFYGAESRPALNKLQALQKNLKRDGAIWVIRPKGVDAITEADVMKAGKAAGLVDVKVVRFSDTHTAEKFVIPVAKRRRKGALK